MLLYSRPARRVRCSVSAFKRTSQMASHAGFSPSWTKSVGVADVTSFTLLCTVRSVWLGVFPWEYHSARFGGWLLARVISESDMKCRKQGKILTWPSLFFLQSATTYIRFWLAQRLSFSCLNSILISSNCVRSCALCLLKRHLPKCFRSSSWSFRHGFPNIPCSYIKQFLFHPFNMSWSS